MKAASLFIALALVIAIPAAAQTIAGSPKEERQGATMMPIEPIHYGKFHIASGAKACMNLPLYSDTPANAQDGDFWIVDTVLVHAICNRASGVVRCRGMVAQ